MNRFPKTYEKPGLISLDDAVTSGWTAACTPGNGATSGGCGFGNAPSGKGSEDGFIDPEIFNQGI